jgi:hypothetical protein
VPILTDTLKDSGTSQHLPEQSRGGREGTMRPHVLIAVGFMLVASLASAQHCRKIDIDRSSGFCRVPDPLR